MSAISKKYCRRIGLVLMVTLLLGVTSAHASAPSFDPSNLTQSLQAVWSQVLDAANNIKSQGPSYIWTLAQQWANTLFNAITNA